jgi:lysophospholipase L1-like esterase
VPRIREVNHWLDAYCASEGLVYLDFYSAMADPGGAMRAGLSLDGVYPSPLGYSVMAPLAERAIAQALER